MQQDELFSRIMELLFNHTGLPQWVPLIGNLDDVVTDWAKNNPEKAEQVTEELYQLLTEYREAKRG